MRGRFRESESAEAPPHQAEIRFSLRACRPLPASGARDAEGGAEQKLRLTSAID
jgi:hypothetical protein